MTFASLLNTTAIVKRPNFTEDTMGGEAASFSPVATIRCRIQPMSGRERAMSGSTGVESTHKMFCLYSVDVRPEDEVTSGGFVYQVTFVGDAAGQGHHLEVDLQRREPER